MHICVRYNPKTGEWAHSTRMTKFPSRKWLSNFSISPLSSTEVSPRLSLRSVDSSKTHTNTPGDVSDKNSVIALLHTARHEALSQLSRVDKIWQKSREMLRKQQQMCINNGKGTSVHYSLRASNGTDSLSAIDNIRWFLIANDIDDYLMMEIARNGSNEGNHVVGPLQPHASQALFSLESKERESFAEGYPTRHTDKLDDLRDVFNGENVSSIYNSQLLNSVDGDISTIDPASQRFQTSAYANLRDKGFDRTMLISIFHLLFFTKLW